MSADQIDDGCKREQEDTEKCIAAAREAASRIEIGFAGTCQECGRNLPRIVRGHCGKCRDDLKL
jgi:hypothetical protein